jgi:hypothetical protein
MYLLIDKGLSVVETYLFSCVERLKLFPRHFRRPPCYILITILFFSYCHDIYNYLFNLFPCVSEIKYSNNDSHTEEYRFEFLINFEIVNQLGKMQNKNYFKQNTLLICLKIIGCKIRGKIVVVSGSMQWRCDDLVIMIIPGTIIH